MDSLAGQIIIFIYCILTAFIAYGIEIFSVSSVVMVVLSVILSSLSYSLLNKYFTFISSGLYGIISLVFPGFIIMSPLILYNTASFKGWQVLFVFIIFITGLLAHYIAASPLAFCMVLLGIILAFYMQYIQLKLNSLVFKFNRNRDDSTEIYNATLKERNRIAREIHDNVGHLLSRSILLTGALKAVNKDESFKESLDNLHETLDQAMTSIRESVHNLHDDSVNLEEAARNIVNNFNFCQAELTYDMGTDVPREIKFSFISILKEGLNNIYKHSNATKTSILLREHPAMYQLVIKDNGTTAGNINNSGIGITNISSRVDMLHGSLQIHTNNGFCIFITIPKP